MSEGPVWCYFGYGVGQERDCASCEAEFLRTGTPPAETKDCWKVEMWPDMAPEPEWLVGEILSMAARDRSLTGKYSVRPVDQGEPGQSGRVLFMYFKSRPAAEEFCGRIVCLVESRGRPAGPGWEPRVRRGCQHFEVTAGPWQTWAE